MVHDVKSKLLIYWNQPEDGDWNVKTVREETVRVLKIFTDAEY